VVRASVLDDTRPSVAYAISRQVGGAVVRNRLRRQLRVACSELAAAGRLEPVPHLIVVRPEAAGADMTTLRDALSAACARLPQPARPGASADGIASSDQSHTNDRSGQ
jgi:ribonuclease P protein component